MGYHGEKPRATSHRLNALSHIALEVSHLQNVYDPNSDQQHVRETRELYGTILAPNDANPLCDFIKNKTKKTKGTQLKSSKCLLYCSVWHTEQQ